MRGPFLIIIGALAVILIAVAATGYFGEKGSGTGVAERPEMLAGAPAASYSVKRIDGAPDALDRYRGHVVFVNLWATWCEPCREEMPALERFSRQESSQGLVVLGIDQGESASTAAAFARTVGVHYPILVDEDQQYGRAYAAIGLPVSIVVNRDGKIVRGLYGQLTFDQMKASVASVLPR